MSDTEKIAKLNDTFRAEMRLMVRPPLLMVEENPFIPGLVLLTRGIDGLPFEDKVRIMEKVKNFNAFSEVNDPHGEHDFGAFTHNARKILWKFDYYDSDLQFRSEDPARVSETQRVLTVMLAHEHVEYKPCA